MKQCVVCREVKDLSAFTGIKHQQMGTGTDVKFVTEQRVGNQGTAPVDRKLGIGCENGNWLTSMV